MTQAYQPSGSENRSRPEYDFPPPNPKYADNPEYREAPRYQAPYTPDFNYYQPAPYPVYRTGPSLNFLLRVVWFIMIGWWLGMFWLFAGYAMCATVIGLPLGLLMLNRLPQVLTLRQPGQTFSYQGQAGIWTVPRYPVQYPFILRAIYYVFVGWWLGWLWSLVAYGLCVSIIGLPFGLLIFNRLPTVISLRQF